MDEILIEEKKYISSKQAAKMTGYAKDYIGQLCREGRVPARLVGRSWYVLETAIQDHRFGTNEGQAAVILPTLDAPHYEVSSDEPLPSINRLQSDADITVENISEHKISYDLDDSWRAWFDRMSDSTTAIDTEMNVPVVKKTEETKIIEDSTDKKDEREDESENDKNVNVPIHAVYRQPPQELLPSVQIEAEPINVSNDHVSQQKTQKRGGRSIMRAVQIFVIVFSMAIASMATIGSGYLDKYLISNSRVWIISGISVYNK